MQFRGMVDRHIMPGHEADWPLSLCEEEKEREEDN